MNKTCSKCNVVLLVDNIASDKRRCKLCYNTYHKNMFQKHKDKHRELMYSWRKENKDKVRKMLTDYKVKKFGSKAACISHYMNIYKEQLTDTYIKTILIKHKEAKLKFSDISEELVNLKRKQLLLKRKITNNG